MPVIRIQEYAKVIGGWQVKVSFDYKAEYDATVRIPFAEDEEQDLAWYFETYPNFPSSKNSNKAGNVAASIKSYGEALFDNVFQDRNAYVAYFKIREAGLSNLHIEIAGNTPQFHALHWEALKDPQRPQPLALQATVTRQNLNPPAGYAPLRTSPTINILIVTARPLVENDADYRAISRPLVEILRNEQTEIHILRPGTFRALENHLSDIENDTDKGKGYYHVIHFDMHGIVCSYEQLQKEQEQTNRYQFTERYGGDRDSEIQEYPDVRAFLLFESEEDHKADLVSDKELCDLLTTYQIPIAILNVCQSGKQVGERETSLGSRLMLAGVQLVLAMGYSVRIQAAEKLMSVLYAQLFKSGDLSGAVHQARKELYNDKKRNTSSGKVIELQDWLLPIIYQNQPLQLSMRAFTQEESNDYYERRDERGKYLQQGSFYEFVGRDIDILQIEKSLLTRHNILLVRGIGGVGKTALFRHLEAWWLITDFMQRTFYFSYDEKAWTLREMMAEIALKFGEKYHAEFVSLSEKARKAKLIQDLSKSHYLLILDHLEVTAGTNLTIQHKLPPDEQDALRNFLNNLARGQTLVLLGSRSGEEWLKVDTFNDNIYELKNLDPEAASVLAKRILWKNHVEKYLQEEDFQELLKLLGNLPLAMEVVLAHLTSHTPKEIIKALVAEDENDGVDEIAKRIVDCIDYLYRYLSPEVQQMQLCLAPFTRILRREPILILYLPYLQQQFVLADLPFSHWLGMIQEAQNWGLLTPDPDTPRILRLQPIFRYFLRGRLDAPEQVKEKQAIETAFLLLYEQASVSIYQQLSSEDQNTSRAAQKLASLEYANLETALHLALHAQVPISGPFQALFKYLDITQDADCALKLAQTILNCMEAYPPEIREGSLCRDYIRVVSKVAFQQAIIHHYSEAEITYLRVLSLLPKLERLNEYEHDKWEADTYQELGNLSFEQNQLSDAESHYKQALQIKEKLGDSRSLVIIYKKLGDLAQQQKNASDANEYYQKALDLFVKLNNLHFQALN